MSTPNRPTGAGQMATPIVAPAISSAVSQRAERACATCRSCPSACSPRWSERAELDAAPASPAPERAREERTGSYGRNARGCAYMAPAKPI